MKLQKYWVVIPNAGTGERFGGGIPKQYLKLGKHTILEHAIMPFLVNPLIEKIVVAVNENDKWFNTLPMSRHSRVVSVTGGQKRSDSVLNALNYLKGKAVDKDWVLVHDAARPCLLLEDLGMLINTVYLHDVGGILAKPVVDTLKLASNYVSIDTTLDRASIYHALTPQMFRYNLLVKAMNFANDKDYNITDESQAVELYGYQPLLVPSTGSNLKITLKEDLILAQALLNKAEKLEKELV